MGIYLKLICDGCGVVVESEKRLESRFVSLSGRSHGLGRRVVNEIGPIVPGGWESHDPLTGCTYCPECWAGITEGPAEDGEGEA